MPNEMRTAEIIEELADHLSPSLSYGKFIQPLRTAASTMRNVAAGEMAEVVHSHWVQINNTQEHYCNGCGAAFNLYAYCKADYKYCPNCGADMRKVGEKHEAD